MNHGVDVYVNVCYETAIVDELLTTDCGNVGRWSHVPRTCKLGIKMFLSSNHQPHRANKRWSSILDVVKNHLISHSGLISH